MRITLKEAARQLLASDVVALPTETVYGLASCFSSVEGVEKIFQLKRRPLNNPLILHLPHSDALLPFVEKLPEGTAALMEAFWPGPLTLVLPVKMPLIDSRIRAGLPTAAFRVPAHPLTCQLMEMTGPLVMPSANLSGCPSATTADHVEEDFGKDFPVVNGGACIRGLESTILSFQGKWKVVRLGSLAPDDFAPVLGYFPQLEIALKEGEAPLCPGQLYRHYAPKAKLQLVEQVPLDFSGCLIGFSDRSYPAGATLFLLGSSADPKEVGGNLYATLRTLDLQGVKEALVDADMPDTGLWGTVKDRLKKASQGNDAI